MASWTNGAPQQRLTQRRKWNIEDKSSLNSLRFQVAESGCSHSQYELARMLLHDLPGSPEAEANSSAEDAADPGGGGGVSTAAATALASDRVANCAQAVHWLMRSADQGHPDALQLLAECYATGRGINDHNVCEVRTFLGQSGAERAARRAARELFACLANGEQHITAAQLERKMRQIWNIQRRSQRYSRCNRVQHSGGDGGADESIDAAEAAAAYGDGRRDLSRSPSFGHRRRRRRHRRSSTPNDDDTDTDSDDTNLTEAHLVRAAVHYSHGRLPAISRELRLSAPSTHSLDHIPCFHRALFHPLTFILLCYHRLVNGVAQLSATLANHLRLLAILLLYVSLSVDSWSTFAPLTAHYVSLSLMLATTLHILRARREFCDFRMWSGLFLQYGDHRVDAAAAERQFLRRRMQPYLWFFVAFCANVMLTPLLRHSAASAEDAADSAEAGSAAQSVDQWMAHSELTVLAICLVFVTLLAPTGSRHLRRRRSADGGASSTTTVDWLCFVSFAVNVLAKYPYEQDALVSSGWRFIDLRAQPNFTAFLLGNGIEFCLSCRGLLYLLIPAQLVLLARRNAWHGTYQYAIPHCVTLAWLQICIISAQSATWFGAMRAAFALAGLLLFLPLFGLCTLMIPVFAAVEWLQLSDPRARLAAALVLAAAAMAASCCGAAHRRGGRYVTAVQCVAGVVAAACLALPYMTANFEAAGFAGVMKQQQQQQEHQHQQHQQHQQQHHRLPPPADASGLSWAQFNEHCQLPALQRHNQIAVQLRCAQLEGVAVQWQGDVESVRLARVHNWLADWVHRWLPAWLAAWVQCALGERSAVPPCLGADCAGSAGSGSSASTQCHLNGWARFEYALVVQMAPGRKSGGLLMGGWTEPGATLRLWAAAAFGNFTQHLNRTDRVWFRGRLRNSGAVRMSATAAGQQPSPMDGAEADAATDWSRSEGGGVAGDGAAWCAARPYVELQAMGCVRCPNAPDLRPVETEAAPADGGGDGEGGGGGGEMRMRERVRDLQRGLKYLLNVLFNPLVTFK